MSPVKTSLRKVVIFMKKFSAIVLAIALSLSAASGFAKDKGAHAACKGLKGKERTECVKSEKAKDRKSVV